MKKAGPPVPPTPRSCTNRQRLCFKSRFESELVHFFGTQTPLKRRCIYSIDQYSNLKDWNERLEYRVAPPCLLVDHLLHQHPKGCFQHTMKKGCSTLEKRVFLECWRKCALGGTLCDRKLQSSVIHVHSWIVTAQYAPFPSWRTNKNQIDQNLWST